MKKETDGGDTSEDVKDTLPSLEDILTPAVWDTRIAKAFARREQVLADGSQPKAAAKKQSKSKKTSSKSKDETPSEVSPAIKDILETANWTDRLAKAKAHRDQVFAERAQSGEAPAAQIPGKMPVLYKDTIRVAVSGEQAESAAEKPKDKKIGAAAFPIIAPVAVEPKRRMGAVYAAAAVVLALGIGWIAPNPIRDSASLNDRGEPAIGDSAAIEETAVAEATLPVAGTPVPEAGPTLLVQPVVFDNIGTISRLELAADFNGAANTPSVVDGADLHGFAVAALITPGLETAPVIRTEPYVAMPDVTATNSADTNATSTPATTVLEASPVFQQAAGAFPRVGNGVDVFEISLRHPVASDPVRAAPSALAANAPDVVAMRINPLRSGSDVEGDYSGVVLLTASIEASSSTFRGAVSSPADVGSILLRNETDPDIQPTNIKFLSGPAITETPMILPLPVTQLAVLAEPQDFALPDVAGIRATSDVAFPVRTAEQVRLASIGVIPVSALQQEPAIESEAPESFEAMTSRLASLSADAVEQKPGFPGADAFTIRLHAPTSLAENKLGAFATALRDTGFSVNEPERVNFTIRNNNVRFFHPGDAEAAQVLAAAVDAKVRDFTDYSPSPPVGTIEVWLAGETPPASSQRPTRRPSGQDPALSELRNRLLLSLRRGDHL